MYVHIIYTPCSVAYMPTRRIRKYVLNFNFYFLINDLNVFFLMRLGMCDCSKLDMSPPIEEDFNVQIL